MQKMYTIMDKGKTIYLPRGLTPATMVSIGFKDLAVLCDLFKRGRKDRRRGKRNFRYSVRIKE